MAIRKFQPKKIVFWVILILIGVASVELVLRLACLVVPRVDQLLGASPAAGIHDDKVRYRPNPGIPEHDAKGFRNRTIPSRVDVVCLGDSMTYGTWVKREDAWPQQLERIGGMSTYNMAFAGWCPVSYLMLLDEALELHPKLIVATFYSGNDLYDAISDVYNGGGPPDLKNSDKSIVKAVSAKDKKDELDKLMNSMFEPHRGLKNFLADNSKIYDLLWLGKKVFVPNFTPPWFWIKYRAASFEPFEVFEEGRLRTVFTPRYRLYGLDQRDPAVVEGLRICLEALRRMDDRLKKIGKKFLVLFIPTKELVFEEIANNGKHKVSEDYKLLVKDEKFVWDTTEKYLKANGIEYVDALPALRAFVRNGDNPYKINHDSHPNENGQEVIAQSVLEEIRSHNLLSNSSSRPRFAGSRMRPHPHSANEAHSNVKLAVPR